MVESVACSGCEVWLLKTEEIEIDYLRRSARVSRLQKIPNTAIRNKKQTEIINVKNTLSNFVIKVGTYHKPKVSNWWLGVWNFLESEDVTAFPCGKAMSSKNSLFNDHLKIRVFFILETP